MKNLKYIGLLAISLGYFSCDVNNDLAEIKGPDVPQVTLSTPNLDFSRYVAVGASFTAGYTDGALFKVGQENSFPNILAGKFKMANGGDFKQPLMNDNIGGLLLGANVIQGPRLYFNGTGPAPLMATPTTQTATKLSGSFNNLGIPGAKSFHLVAPGYGSLNNVPLGLANPYFARMSSSANATVLGDAMSQNPTFFTLSEVGGNDVLGYALSGGDGSNPITSSALFNQAFGALVQTLTSGGAKGVVGNVPYITSLSHFTTVPYNAVPLNAATASQLNAAFAAYNNGLDQLLAAKNANALPAPILALLANFNQAEVTKRKISFKAGQNAVLILDEHLTNLTPINAALTNMRQATKDDLLVLTASSFLGTTVGGNAQLINGVSVPLADKWVLTPQEQLEIKNATDAYNTTIEATVNANPNLALVDFKGVLVQAQAGIKFDQYTMNTALVRGGLVSLDGVHLTSRGYALMANQILSAMDAKFGTNFTKATGGLAKADDYPTNYSPTLR